MPTDKVTVVVNAGKAQAGRPSWIAAESSSAWDALSKHCGPLLAECNMNEGQLWAPWANSPAPEAEYPPSAAARLNAFQRLLLIQVPNLCTASALPLPYQSVSEHASGLSWLCHAMLQCPACCHANPLAAFLPDASCCSTRCHTTAIPVLSGTAWLLHNMLQACMLWMPVDACML